MGGQNPVDHGWWAPRQQDPPAKGLWAQQSPAPARARGDRAGEEPPAPSGGDGGPRRGQDPRCPGEAGPALPAHRAPWGPLRHGPPSSSNGKKKLIFYRNLASLFSRVGDRSRLFGGAVARGMK